VPVSKLAETDLAASTATVQESVPEHPLPLHPVKMEPAEGDAVKVTLAPFGKADEQADPQAMPAGLLVILPLPAPVLLTERVKESPDVKSAETALAAFMVSVQVSVPVHPPLQPVKMEPADGDAVRVTTVLVGKADEQAGSQ